MKIYRTAYISILGMRVLKIDFFYTKRQGGYSLGVKTEKITPSTEEKPIFLNNTFLGTNNINKVKEILDLYRNKLMIEDE